MEGMMIGVFGSDQQLKSAFETSVGKKSEAEGMIVYTRSEAGRRISFLDDSAFPDRIQGYARIASIADHACYAFPRGGRLAAPDGELAVLLDSFGLGGRVLVFDGSVGEDTVRGQLKGTAVGGYPVEQRPTGSSVFESASVVMGGPPDGHTLICIDRAFPVRGVGTVALGFVLAGSVSVHDELRPLPGGKEAVVEVKGIQISDEDFESAGRGIRVGLALRGIDASELEGRAWLDDGSYPTSDRLEFEFKASPFYRQGVAGRNLHLQLPGQLVPAYVEPARGGGLVATLPSGVPVWRGMKVGVIDLNGRALRVSGGGACKI